MHPLPKLLLFIQKKDERDLGAARKFIKSSVSERLKIVSNMVSAISKEKMTRREAIDFMEDVELSVYEDLGVEKGKSFLKAIEVARKYANDRAPSMKMLLEFLAISH